MFSLGSEENWGLDNSIVIKGSSNVSFFTSFFRGNESSGFRGNIGEHTGMDFSITRLGIKDPSVDTSSGTNRVFFVSWHTSLSCLTPTAMNISSTEITILDSQTEFVVIHFGKFTVISISNWGVNSVP